jgi:hypothetical protein
MLPPFQVRGTGTEETMRTRPGRAVGTIATAATVLVGSSVAPAPAGQTRGALNVTVEVVATCGGAVGSGGTATVGEGCAPGSAPMAVATESAPSSPADPAEPSAATPEGSGELRYLTLIY